MRALDHGARADEAVLRQQGRAQPGLRRPAGMQALGPGALGEILDDPRRHAAGDAQRIDDLASIQAEGCAHADRRPHGAEHGGGVEAGPVDQPRRHEAQAAQGLCPHRDAEESRLPGPCVPLAGRQHRGHDHRAGVHGTALEGIVEVLAVCGSAVDEGGTRRAQRAAVPDGGARPLVVPGGEGSLHIRLVARCHAEANHVQHQILAGLPRRPR